MSAADALAERCARAGVLTGYVPAGGGWFETGEPTLRRLLALLGDSPAPNSHFSEARPPTPCIDYTTRIRGHQSLGIWLNLYTLRGERDLGIGNFSHVRELVDWSAAFGIDFIGLSPLHVTRNAAPEISPYSPVSRLFLNPLYIDPWAVPEFERSSALAAHLAREDIARELRELRELARTDYARSLAVLDPVLDLLYAQFCREREQTGSDRSRAFEQFTGALAPELERFTTYVCLCEHFARSLPKNDWHAWPPEFQDPSSSAVAEFRARNAAAIERHAFVQFEADRQLGAAQARARALGMKIGLYRDLALSSHRDGFDTWAFPDLFMTQVRLGAPPDGYAAGGQDWALPALDPRRLAGDDPHPYVAALLRTNLRHSGALRIDHVMGLFRQYWIPEDLPARQGGYVQFPGLDLMHQIGCASKEHDALIVGEDLGTVPDELAAHMERSRMLSCRVFFFERDRREEFKPPAEFLTRALVTATTHDFPTLAGYVGARDLEIQHELGMWTKSELQQKRREREADVARLRTYLSKLGVSALGAEGDPLDLTRALYLVLRQTPCRLLGLGLDNLCGELDPVNVPGVSVKDYPSWSRRMRDRVSEIVRAPEIESMLRTIAAARPPTRADEPNS